MGVRVKEACDKIRYKIDKLKKDLNQLETKCGHKNKESKYVNTDGGDGSCMYFEFNEHTCLDCGKVWTTSCD